VNLNYPANYIIRVPEFNLGVLSYYERTDWDISDKSVWIGRIQARAFYSTFDCYRDEHFIGVF